jgi:hypothetical protein
LLNGTPSAQPTSQPTTLESVVQERYGLRNRKADPDNILEEREAKNVKAMLAIAQNIYIGLDKAVHLSAIGVQTIPVPKSYNKALDYP